MTSDDCRRSALRFLSGWTSQLHALGRRSGVYSSVSAGIHALDNADSLSPGSYEMPDQVWYAWYNGRADVDIASQWVRADSWTSERVHQYEAQTTVVHGGVPLTIDRNFLELDGGSQAPRSVLACGRTRLDFPAYPRLKPGSRGDRVTALQCLLRTNARYRGKLDGNLDRDVVRAVARFQRRHDLRATGKPDGATWTALFARGSSPLMKVGSSGKSALRLQRALVAAGQRFARLDGDRHRPHREGGGPLPAPRRARSDRRGHAGDLGGAPDRCPLTSRSTCPCVAPGASVAAVGGGCTRMELCGGKSAWDSSRQ